MLKEIMKYQESRNLHLQRYSENNEAKNVLEEIFEAWGYDIPKEHRQAVLNPLLGQVEEHLTKAKGVTYQIPTDYDKVDAFNDIIVFAVGAIMKLGYDPMKTSVETLREINSRKGEIVNGKFEKYKDDKHKALWYKADYSNCKLLT